MTAHLLFWHEPDVRYERSYSWIHKHCGAYGLVPLVIDPTRTWATARPDLPQLIYHSLADVLADPRFVRCEFVWLDAGGTPLHEFDHPVDNVVYCVGSDADGFGNASFAGSRVQVLDTEAELYAAFVIPILCYDRWLYLQGRRT